MDWCRWHNGTSTDAKWRVVARRAGVPVYMVLAVWPFLIEEANQGTARGTMDSEPDAESIAAATEMEPGQVADILAAMQGKVLNGQRLTGWEKRNPKRERENPDHSTERVRKLREKANFQHSATPPVEATCDHVTPSNARNNPERRERIDIKEPTPLVPPPTENGGRADRRGLEAEMTADLTRYAETEIPDAVKRRSFVAKVRGVIAGEDRPAWEDGKGQPTPWEDRPRLFRLALDRLAAGDSQTFRGALRWVVPQQLDPDRQRPAIVGAVQSRESPVLTDTPSAELAKLRAERPSDFTAAVADLERYAWWPNANDFARLKEIRQWLRDQPRIVA